MRMREKVVEIVSLCVGESDLLANSMMNAGVDTREWTDNDEDSRIQKGMQILHFLIIVQS